METLNIFILTLFQHGFKVRYSTLFHLLKGKRTGSMLIYGFFNHNLNYLGLFPRLSETNYNKIIHELIRFGYLVIDEPKEELVMITAKGREYLAEENGSDLTEINSFLYSRIDEDFYDLLLFASQVVSEAVHGNRTYYPIESNPRKQYLLRQWYHRHQGASKELSQQLLNEWQHFFHLLPRELRDGVSLLLSGNGQVGLTFQQLASQRDWDLQQALLQRKHYLHLLLSEMRLKPSRYLVFNELLSLLQPQLMNQSALKTYQLFLSGESLTDLVDRRRIKLSTITDHLVEGAIIFEDFPFQRLLTDSMTAQLMAYYTEEPDFRHWRFAKCREVIPAISFLEFRLFQILQVRNEENVSFRKDVT